MYQITLILLLAMSIKIWNITSAFDPGLQCEESGPEEWSEGIAKNEKLITVLNPMLSIELS